MTTDPRDGLMSMRELAEALGVTRQRVWQIARARRHAVLCSA
jgi:transcriptional regulator with XRE-family HTH domain